MERYLFLIILVLCLYYSYICYQNKENFADVGLTETSAVDETNSINILAKIAADLQAGKGLRVLGDLIVDKSAKIAGAKTTPTGSGDMMTWFNNPDGNNYIRGNTNVAGDLNSSGKIKADKGVVGVGNITMQAANNKDIHNISLARTDEGNVNHSWAIWHMNKDYGQNELQFWEYPSVDSACCNKRVTLHAMNRADKSWRGMTIHGSLYTEGNLILTSSVYRKHQIAGYFQIRAYGLKVPIYYGLNMMWPDNNIKEAIRRKWGWPEFMFNYTGVDMRNAGDGDQNWTPRYLTVLPGYKAKIYGWNNALQQREGVYQAGEYPFGDTNYRVHGIFVSLAEEGDAPDLINW